MSRGTTSQKLEKFLSDGEIDITNVYQKKGFDGEVSQFTETDWVVEPEIEAKLEVQFLWLFTLDYWVEAPEEKPDNPFC